MNARVIVVVAFALTVVGFLFQNLQIASAGRAQSAALTHLRDEYDAKLRGSVGQVKALREELEKLRSEVSRRSEEIEKAHADVSQMHAEDSKAREDKHDAEHREQLEAHSELHERQRREMLTEADRLRELFDVHRENSEKAERELEARVQKLEGSAAASSQQKSSTRTARQWPWRAAAVRRTIKTAWEAYRINALGFDEINPVTNQTRNWDRTNVQMVGLIDSLSTLWVSGLQDEFKLGAEHLKSKFAWRPSGNVALFETTIRVLGGLLSSYALSRDEGILAKAAEVGESLVEAYSGRVTRVWGGYPRHVWDPRRREAGAGFGTYLAEVGSVQLEWRYLAHATNDKKFDEGVTRVMDLLEKVAPDGGGFIGSSYSSYSAGSWSGGASLGSYSDSYYEYLLKQWLITGRRETRYLRMYQQMADTLVEKLVVRSGNLTWLSEGSPGGGTVTAQGTRFEHLACFVPGMLALGSVYMPPDQGQKHLEAAERLGEFCASLYFSTATGLSPDEVTVADGKVTPGKRSYPLRPETVESLFYLWRVTGDTKWREYGWEIYKSIERHCRVCKNCEASGYSEIGDVFHVPVEHTGHMDTFFLAETLKYLYLLFADDSALDLDCWVFNTEAHPLPVFPPIGSDDAAGVPSHCRPAPQR